MSTFDKKRRTAILENMTNTQRKWVAVAIGIAVLAIAGSQFPFGSTLAPSPTPALAPTPASLYPSTASSTNSANAFRLDSILISFQKRATAKDREAIIRALDATVIDYDPRIRIAEVKFPPKTDTEILKIVQQLDHNPLVEFASPDIPLRNYGVH